MAKPRKKAAAPEAPIVPSVGDKVTIPRIGSVLEVHEVSRDGTEVTLQRPGTNLQWFRVKADTLTYVDRKPPAKTSNPFTTPQPGFDADEMLERIRTVQEENLQRLDDDIDILKAYLKTQHAPKVAIEVIEGLTVEQHVSWKKAVERIKKLLGNRDIHLALMRIAPRAGQPKATVREPS
jgi:hypothetical protein